MERESGGKRVAESGKVFVQSEFLAGNFELCLVTELNWSLYASQKASDTAKLSSDIVIIYVMSCDGGVVVIQSVEIL